jgi:hypothetical protein
MTDFISILQSAALEASELEAKRPPAGSKEWKLNYKWLINPKVKCPWCLEWVPTGRVWVVDEAETKVRRLWTLAGERLDVTLCHPHVGEGGKICMGNARTAVDALLAGISNDAYPGAKPADWFPRELGHECPTMGGALEGEEDDEGTFTCYGCDEQYDEDDSFRSDHNDRLYCSDCYYENHTSCTYCGNDYHDSLGETRSTPEGEYCNDCFSEKFFDCEGCGDVFKLAERLGDDRCESCYTEKWESCSECGEESEVEDRELDDSGLCENCRPEPDVEAEVESEEETEEEIAND